MRDTPTLGLRYRLEHRFELERRECAVDTAYGPVSVKIGTLEGRVLQAWPEYEDCAALAGRHGISLWQVQQAALDAYASLEKSESSDDPPTDTKGDAP